MKRSRRTKWAVLAGAGLALLAPGSAQHVGAQGPFPSAGVPHAGDPSGGKIYTNKNVFKLPIKIDNGSRGTLKEVVLYVKTGPGGWVRAESADPARDHFLYRTPQDGEYWFSVVTVDRAGATNPRDVQREPPGLIVVVDTAAPLVELQPATANGQPCLRCVTQDANPNPESLKVLAHGTDQALRPLEVVPGQPGLFRLPPPESFTGSVRVAVTDRVGNATTRDFNLKAIPALAQLLTAPAQAPAAAGVVPAVAGMDTTRPGTGVVQAHHTVAKPSTLPAPEGPGLVPASATAPGVPAAHAAPANTPGDSGRKAGSPQRQILNGKHATLEYRIDPIGPSGVGKVEVYVTADKGATWQRLAEDADRRSPAEIDLPGEGLYGVRLVVTNGNGFGGTPPAPGEAPSTWIEVDATAPTAQLRNIDPNTSGGALEIRWMASDKNLGDQPISLFYATRREGPWLPLARNVRNEGSHRWEFPRDAGGQFFVRLEAADQAGNVTRCETPTPVVLDLTEPKAQVVGVTGMTAGTPPTGN